jgi:hypothetical protein
VKRSRRGSFWILKSSRKSIYQNRLRLRSG